MGGEEVVQVQVDYETKQRQGECGGGFAFMSIYVEGDRGRC